MHQHFPSLKALRAFEAVVRHGSASKAAEELHVSPGAVGHQIRSFEQEIGFRLFDRNAGEMTPTADALEIAGQVRNGFDQIFSAVRRLRLSRDPSFLTVGCEVTFGILWFGPRLARFQEKHPEIEMRLNLTDLVPDSHWHGADVTIHCGDGWYEGGQAIKLTSESLSPVCSPSLIGKSSMSPAALSPSDLASLPLLHVEWFEPETTFRTLAWERWFAAAGVDTDGRELAGTHFSHTASAIQLAIAGKGVALASDCLAADAIAAGLLVRPFDMRLKMSRDYYLVYSDSVADLAKVKAFRDWLVAETEQLRSA